MLMNILREREMPDGWLDSIAVAKANPTERTYLEDSIQRHASLKNEAAYEVISRIFDNEDSTDYTALRQWLDSLQHPMADAYKALSYMETSVPDTALSQLRGVYAKYDLSVEDSIQLNSIDTALTYYANWFNLQTDTILPGDATVFSAATIALFDSLASIKNEFLTGTQTIRNMLNTLYGRNYFTSAYLPEVFYAKRDGNERDLAISSPKVVEQANPNFIKVYPNPAKNFVVFESKTEYPIKIAVYDLYGKKVTEKEILPLVSIKIETIEWLSGVYTWKGTSEAKNTVNGKLIITRW